MVVSSDVVENILTRLHVKDLLRCKSVCKSWYSLMSCPYFVKAHSKHNDFGQTRIAMPTYWKIPNHQNLYQHNKWKLFGSSNGLVCVSIIPSPKDALILLINPWTREVRELPIPKEITYEHDVSLSFGYDSLTDDYKLVAGINEMSGVHGSFVQVLSLKSMTWKLIGDINYRLLYGKPGVLFNGALHWFVDDPNNMDHNPNKRQLAVILSFDLSREEFKVIPVPDDSRYVVTYSTLGVFEDSLCISCVNDLQSYYGIWIMRNYNVKQSWEFFLPNEYKIKFHDAIHYMNIYDCTSPQKKRMAFFCDDKPYMSRSGNHILTAHVYVQSLVSPHINSERPNHAGSAKVAERECQQMHNFKPWRKSRYDSHPQEKLRKIVALYKLEGGQNEKSYLREVGETTMKKSKRRDVNNMSKIEGYGGKYKRKRNQ